MKKMLSVIVAATMAVTFIPTFSFAIDEMNSDSYNIESVSELTEIVNEACDDNSIELLDVNDKEIALEDSLLPDDVAEKIIENTPAEVMTEFIDEKTELAFNEAAELMDNIELEEVSPGEYTGHATAYLEDNCYVEVEVFDMEDPGVLSRLQDYVCPEAYALSRSGHSVVWKKYGNRYYTAKTKVFYGVAYGMFALENHYKLSAKGIDERYGYAYSEDSGLIRVSEGSPIITTDKATKIGKSTCITCNFKAKKGYHPIEWTKSYKMKTRVKYVAKDAKAKEIKVNQNWDFKSL